MRLPQGQSPTWLEPASSVRRLTPPHRPWPYIDTLSDQESDAVIDAKIPAILGSCGHDDGCADCKHWIAYPQSHFGNWTLKPVRRCGIERAVKGREGVVSVVYSVGVGEDGGFGGGGVCEVTPENRRAYWREALVPEVRACVRSCLGWMG
jgi:hypothetical protein